MKPGFAPKTEFLKKSAGIEDIRRQIGNISHAAYREYHETVF
jgi:hypothetical protein